MKGLTLEKRLIVIKTIQLFFFNNYNIVVVSVLIVSGQNKDIFVLFFNYRLDCQLSQRAKNQLEKTKPSKSDGLFFIK